MCAHTIRHLDKKQVRLYVSNHYYQTQLSSLLCEICWIVDHVLVDEGLFTWVIGLMHASE